MNSAVLIRLAIIPRRGAPMGVPSIFARKLSAGNKGRRYVLRKLSSSTKLRGAAARVGLWTPGHVEPDVDIGLLAELDPAMPMLEQSKLASLVYAMEVEQMIPLKKYYSMANVLLRHMDDCRASGEDERLLLLTLQFISLVVHTLPQHKQYKTDCLVDRRKIRKKFDRAVAELEVLIPVVLGRLMEHNSLELASYYESNENMDVWPSALSFS